MPEILLRLSCSVSDAEPLAAALHAHTGRVVHLRDETVFGRDFSDATTAERVAGQLKRCIVEIRIEEGEEEGLLSFVSSLKRAGPVRWLALPILAAGRLS